VSRRTQPRAIVRPRRFRATSASAASSADDGDDLGLAGLSLAPSSAPAASTASASAPSAAAASATAASPSASTAASTGHWGYTCELGLYRGKTLKTRWKMCAPGVFQKREPKVVCERRESLIFCQKCQWCKAANTHSFASYPVSTPLWYYKLWFIKDISKCRNRAPGPGAAVLYRLSRVQEAALSSQNRSEWVRWPFEAPRWPFEAPTFVHGLTLVCARQSHEFQILTIREFGTPGGAGSSEPLAESSEVRGGAGEEEEEAGDSMSAGGKAARGSCGGKRVGLGADRLLCDLSTQAPVTAASMLLTSTGSISVLFEALSGVTSMLGRPRRSAQCALRTSRLM
jgi:hypothetical protein